MQRHEDGYMIPELDIIGLPQVRESDDDDSHYYLSFSHLEPMQEPHYYGQPEGQEVGQ